MFLELTDLKGQNFLLNIKNIIDISKPSMIDSHTFTEHPGASLTTVDKRRYVCVEKYDDIKKWVLCND